MAAGARFFLGLAEVAGGHPDSAMTEVNLGFRVLEESRTIAGMTVFLSWLAVAQALAGKTDDALKTVEGRCRLILRNYTNLAVEKGGNLMTKPKDRHPRPALVPAAQVLGPARPGLARSLPPRPRSS